MPARRVLTSARCMPAPFLSGEVVGAEQISENKDARRVERSGRRCCSHRPLTVRPGCDRGVPPYPPDVDCADVGGPVQVLGSDPHGLDADRDGLGCE
jgi:hypothetical protein